MGEFGLQDLYTILGALLALGVCIVAGAAAIVYGPRLGRALALMLDAQNERRPLVRFVRDMSSVEGVPERGTNEWERGSDAVEHDREPLGTGDVFRVPEIVAWLEHRSDDELLNILARLQNADGGERFADSRLAKFIGGRVEDRVAQVRAVRAKPAPEPQGRPLTIRSRADGEHVVSF